MRMRSRLDAFVVFCASFTLYLLTLQPDFGGPEDTPKFQFLGYVLGTAHPPGYPLYVMLSHLFVGLPLGTIAYRANLFSALMAAVACALAYGLARMLGSGRWPAVCAALGLATGASFWRSATIAEVYALAAVMAASTVALVLAWDGCRRVDLLLAAIATFGLGLGNHLTIVGLAPALVIYVIARDRHVVTPKIVTAAAAILILCISQYAFIILRTVQHAPYLESRATSVSELVDVITAKRFADQRFSFGPRALLTTQIPIVLTTIGHEMGPIGVLLLALGVIGAARTRNARAALVGGAAVGTLAMVVNVSGDVKGFITPVAPLLWPLTALGVSSTRLQPSVKRTRDQWSARLKPSRYAIAVVVLAALAPVSNVIANYHESDRSDQIDDGRFFRGFYAQLPDRAGVITEDYFSDMAMRYVDYTGEGGPSRGIVRVGFGAAQVRAAAAEGRRVFAFGVASAFLGAEGLSFERTPLAGPSIEEWIRSVPRGTVLVGAAASSAVPLALSGAVAPGASRRPRAYSAFARLAGSPRVLWRDDDGRVSLPIEAGAIASRAIFPGMPVASADDRGARVVLDDRTVAEVDRGLALAVFRSDGSPWRFIELRTGDPLQVPFERAVYELKADTPCVRLAGDAWMDVTAAFSTGSALATVHAPGMVAFEMSVDDSCPVESIARELLGGGTARSFSSADHNGGTGKLVAELQPNGLRPPLFRVALACVPQHARARLRAAGTESTLAICAHRPGTLIRDRHDRAAIDPTFEAEAYFGSGWGDVERTPTGRLRRGSNRTALLLPLADGDTYELSLDIGAGSNRRLRAELNGTDIGTCELAPARASCTVVLPAAVVRRGVNALTLSPVAPGEPTALIFRRALVRRLER